MSCLNKRTSRIIRKAIIDPVDNSGRGGRREIVDPERIIKCSRAASVSSSKSALSFSNDVTVLTCSHTQRQPMLPYASSPRPLISSILDTALTFLRHNLRKKLDVGSYILALKLVLKVMQSLRARTVRLSELIELICFCDVVLMFRGWFALAYDWVSLWRSILSLSAFVVSKIDVIEDSSNIDELISQVCYSFSSLSCNSCTN